MSEFFVIKFKTEKLGFGGDKNSLSVSKKYILLSFFGFSRN